ncbi:MAG: hypothetical protein ACD_84C00014G0005 [uncultured bacterium]|nr:MAG: hypothetical protein ACD_84C00014G0005 [uncultured bacterium]
MKPNTIAAAVLVNLPKKSFTSLSADGIALVSSCLISAPEKDSRAIRSILIRRWFICSFPCNVGY